MRKAIVLLMVVLSLAAVAGTAGAWPHGPIIPMSGSR